MIRVATFAAAAFVVLAALRPVPASAASPPMLPLEVGRYWEYDGVAGAHQVETITGTRTLRGRTVFVKSYTAGPDAGLENYWLTGPDGEVLLAGFDAPGGGLALAYEPPITVCGGAPAIGDQWPAHVTAYDLTDDSVFDSFDITYSALEQVVLFVPAGSFDCIGVGQVGPTPSPADARLAGRGLTPDGRRVVTAATAAVPNVSDWFSPGVGLVQYRGADTFQLAGYGSGTPVRTASWGALKAAYR